MEILSGPHKGTKVFRTLLFNLDECLVGRSAGKKCKTLGLSLVSDNEVSTSHGKFTANFLENDDSNEAMDVEKENKADNVKNKFIGKEKREKCKKRKLLLFYEDTGSTNGTFIVEASNKQEGNERKNSENERQIPEKTELHISEGDLIRFGQSWVKIASIKTSRFEDQPCVKLKDEHPPDTIVE